MAHEKPGRVPPAFLEGQSAGLLGDGTRPYQVNTPRPEAMRAHSRSIAREGTDLEPPLIRASRTPSLSTYCTTLVPDNSAAQVDLATRTGKSCA